MSGGAVHCSHYTDLISQTCKCKCVYKLCSGLLTERLTQSCSSFVAVHGAEVQTLCSREPTPEKAQNLLELIELTEKLLHWEANE